MLTNPRIRRERRGTILVFLVSALAVVAVMINALVRSEEQSAASASASHTSVMADALALSGIELLVTIDEQATDFLTHRYREFPEGTGTPISPAYTFEAVFGISEGGTIVGYLAPIEFPALKDVVLGENPVEQYWPNYYQDSDVQLPVSYSQTAASISAVPASTPAALLPAPGHLPSTADTCNYPHVSLSPSCSGGNASNCGVRTLATAAGMAIEPLQPSDVPSASTPAAIAWLGPVNLNSATAPWGNNTPHVSTFQNNSTKIPLPSLIFATPDLPGPGDITYRGYIYAWYARRTKTGFPDEHFLMTSGRIRKYFVGELGTWISTEVGVSKTQIR